MEIYESTIPCNEKNKEMVKLAQVVDIEWKTAEKKKIAGSRKSEVKETNQENSKIIMKSVGKSHGLMEDSVLLELQRLSSIRKRDRTVEEHREFCRLSMNRKRRSLSIEEKEKNKIDNKEAKRKKKIDGTR